MAEFTTTVSGADPWGRMPGGQYYKDWGHPSGQIDWSQMGQNVISQSGGANMPGGSRAGGPFILTEPLGTNSTAWPGDWDQVNQNVAYPGTSYQASGYGYNPSQSTSTDTSSYSIGNNTNNSQTGGTMGNLSNFYGQNYTNPTNVNSTQTNFSEAPFSVDKFMQPFNFEGQISEENKYLSGLTNFLQSQEKTPDMYNRLSGQLNLPNQREAMLGMGEMGEQLYSQIYGMPQNVALTSRESTMTAPQRQRVIESRQAPLQEQYSEIGRQKELAGARLTSAEQELGKRMEMGLAEQQRMMSPWDKQSEFLTDRWSREMTGYTFANEMELNRLIQNSENGLNWTVEQKKRANELADMEMRYKIAKLEADTDLQMNTNDIKAGMLGDYKNSEGYFYSARGNF